MQLNMDLVCAYGRSFKLSTKHCKKLNLTQREMTKYFSGNFNTPNAEEFAPFENLIKQIVDETEVIFTGFIEPALQV